jgi:hypothetical protein
MGSSSLPLPSFFNSYAIISLLNCSKALISGAVPRLLFKIKEERSEGSGKKTFKERTQLNKWQRMKLELCYFIDIVLVIDYYTGGGGLRVPSTQSLNLLGMGNP